MRGGARKCERAARNDGRGRGKLERASFGCATLDRGRGESDLNLVRGTVFCRAEGDSNRAGDTALTRLRST